MKIAIGSDHRGYDMKKRLVPLMESLGHEVTDVGTLDSESVDYPDFAYIVARKVGVHEVDRGILMCGTGLGMCIVANKIRGVRAVTCQDTISAEMSRRHNDANVLCMSADLTGEDRMEQMVRIWLSTEFEGGRHARRVEKISRIENGETL